MSDYTPSLATAREVFIEGAQGEFLGEDFDRMIEAVRAEEREKVVTALSRVDLTTGDLARIAARIRNQEAGE